MSTLDECYCDYQLASSSAKEGDGDCNMNCSGLSSEQCGGPNRLSVYSVSLGNSPSSPSTNPGLNGWRYAGCYTDSTSARSLQFSESVDGGPSAMTVAKCTATCQVSPPKDQDFAFADV